MSGVDSSVLQGWLLCWNTHFSCGLGFRQVACAIGGVSIVGVAQCELQQCLLYEQRASRNAAVSIVYVGH